jgi:hypothetical protein
VLDRGVLLKASIVNQDIDGTELLKHSLEHGLDLRLIGDVGLVSVDPAAAVRSFFNDLFRGRSVGNEVDNHIRAGMGQRDGDAFANTGAGTRTRAFCPFNTLRMGQAGITTSGRIDGAGPAAGAGLDLLSATPVPS